MIWQVRGRTLSLERPFVFGILNITPDSFSDGGLFASPDEALAHAQRMVDEGADGIDIGGESTRPRGARAVSAEEEIRRILPVVAGVRARFADLPISVDTTKSEVAKVALDAGADIINDVSAFRIDSRMGEIAAATGAGVILMHSRGGVANMATYQFARYGEDIVAEVLRELEASIRGALASGVGKDTIVIDPGIGFAKRSDHSLRVLAGVSRIVALGYPVLLGVSRKRFVGELSRVESPHRRVAGTVAANVTGLLGGARLFRVHDVAANRQGLDVAWGVMAATNSAAARQQSTADSPRPASPGTRPPHGFAAHPPDSQD